MQPVRQKVDKDLDFAILNVAFNAHPFGLGGVAHDLSRVASRDCFDVHSGDQVHGIGLITSKRNVRVVADRGMQLLALLSLAEDNYPGSIAGYLERIGIDIQS